MSLFWIETGATLRLAIVLRPRGGDWLEDELARMKRDGVDILVSMLTSSEATELGLTSEARLSLESGIEFHNFAIPDRETPESFAPIPAFLANLSHKLHQGKSLAVHCRASIGRSSLLLACLLCTEDMSPNDAFTRITQARGVQVPDTPEQVRWVERFAASLPAQEQ